jgi:hypothetical protein
VQVADRVRSRVGATVVVTAGFVVMTAALLAGSRTGTGTAYSWILAWTTATGVGLGLALPPSMDIALGALGPSRAGIGSGMTQALRQVGGTLGVALLGAVLNGVYRGAVDVSGLPAEAADRVRASAETGLAAAGNAPQLMDSVQAAFAQGMDAMLLVAAAVTAVAAVLAWRYLPAAPEDVPADDDQPEPDDELVSTRTRMGA